MPIKFTGKHICEKCKKEFEWNYFELQRQKDKFDMPIVEEIPRKILVHNFYKNNEGNYSVEVNCPFCDYDNQFSFDG